MFDNIVSRFERKLSIHCKVRILNHVLIKFVRPVLPSQLQYLLNLVCNMQQQYTNMLLPDAQFVKVLLLPVVGSMDVVRITQ